MLIRRLGNLYSITRSKSIKIVPLLVGSVSQSSMVKYADVLSRYWNDQGTFWVISSDFCHWFVAPPPSPPYWVRLFLIFFETRKKFRYFHNRGTRFSHTPYYPTLPCKIHPPVPPSTLSPAPNNHIITRPITLSRGKEWEEEGRPKIWESIEAMDHEALGVLVDAGKEGCEREFRKYLDRTEVSWGFWA
jgi:MEMO1 family protein